MSASYKQEKDNKSIAVTDIIGVRSMAGGKWRWLIALGVAIALLAAWFGLRNGRGPVINYQTTPASVGQLVVKVSATGNLQPTNQVDVGSELSGTVEAVFVDDNDRIKKGQILMRLDVTKLQDQVAKSEAALAQAQAQVVQAESTTKEARVNLQRLREVFRLSGGKVPAQTELSTAEATLERAIAAEASGRASVKQALATLRTDRTNVTKSSIRSPIDGVVLLRKIEPGQTVAASLQAPVLFTLAESLSQMQLQVNVDEADVGQVKAGQSARFNVDAYPDRSYPAQITRVGFGAQTTNGVVSYQTILNVDNSDLSLRPGMTATADITTLVRDQALLVPNAALRWAPPAPDPGKQGGLGALIPKPPDGSSTRLASGLPAKGSRQVLWVLGGDGKPQAMEVSVGASDGRVTQISGGALQAGQAVITDSAPAKP